jgi:hypothetical protein
MENFLSALAFAGLIAAQFLSVVLVQTQRCDDQFLGTWNRKASIPARWQPQGRDPAVHRTPARRGARADRLCVAFASAKEPGRGYHGLGGL